MSDWIEKAKDFIKGHPDQAGQGIDKAEELINERTDGTYADQLDQGTDKVREGLGLPPQAQDAQSVPATPPNPQAPGPKTPRASRRPPRRPSPPPRPPRRPSPPPRRRPSLVPHRPRSPHRSTPSTLHRSTRAFRAILVRRRSRRPVSPRASTTCPGCPTPTSPAVARATSPSGTRPSAPDHPHTAEWPRPSGRSCRAGSSGSRPLGWARARAPLAYVHGSPDARHGAGPAEACSGGCQASTSLISARTVPEATVSPTLAVRPVTTPSR